MKLSGTIDTISYGGRKTKLEISFGLGADEAKQIVDWIGQRLIWDVQLASPFGPLFDEAEALGQYMVDGVIFPIHVDRQHITGHEIRELAGLELVAPLWLVVVEQGAPDASGFAEVTTSYEVIEPTAVVDLADGMRFVSTLGETDDEPDEGAEEGDAEIAAAVADDRVAVAPNGRGAE